MQTKMILFDLDGTLLPMDQDQFTEEYFHSLAAYMTRFGFEPKTFGKSIWLGLGAMKQNDGSRTNEAVFWDAFCSVWGKDALSHLPEFEAFYREKYDEVSHICGVQPKAAPLLQALRQRGIRLTLATNPLFPRIAIEKRCRWAGVEPSLFEHITVYENSSYSKPNPDYYREILQKVGCRAEECVMVGNDVGDDMVAETVGMRVFLLTDLLINPQEVPISRYPHGNYDDLANFLEQLP